MDRANLLAVRQPLAPAFLGAVAGIVADALWQWPAVAWLAGFAVAACACRRWRWPLALLALPLAAAWHAERTRRYPADDLGAVAEPRRLTRVRGWLATPPRAELPPPDDPLTWRQKPHASFRLTATERTDGANGWAPASGTVAITVEAAALPHLPGDWVEVVGWLGPPRGPLNPGEHDGAAALARQRIRSVMYCESAAAVLPLARPNAAPIARFREELVRIARQRLRAALGAEAPLAEAALLGDKSALRRDELEPYFTSGTMHLLVVSGWHIALAAWLATRFARRLSGAPAFRALAGFAAAWGYTWLTGMDPPAVRAAVVFSVYALAELRRRPAHPLNGGWAAGLALLCWDPTQVFQTGAQLSALAAAALVLFPWRGVATRVDGDGLPLEWWRQPVRTVAAALLASTLAWLAAAPLVATQFHLFSPASIVLSVALAPVLALGLGGAAVVACCPGVPIVGLAAAKLAALALAIVEALPRLAESWPGAYFHLAGPPGWWSAGWCAALYLPFTMPDYRRTKPWHAAAIGAWLLVGAVAQEFGRRPAEVRYHQLAVGHGNCGVLRTPDGRTALFDAGCMAGPRIAERTIAPFLWADGVAGIDAVFLSHADTDHFNALPALAKRFRIGAVYVPPQFARFRKPAVAAACGELAALGVPIRFIWEGDVLRLGEVALRVELPGAADRGRNDNADSLAIRLECRGRTVLNTGDLAYEGLAKLLARPRQPCDVLVAPHHGSRTSNPPELAAWTRPGAAVSSQGPFFRTDLSAFAALGAALFRTDQDGCVTLAWHGAKLDARAFASRRTVPLP